MDKEEASKASLHELRIALQTQAFERLAGVEVNHPALPKPILINRKGLKHCISRRYPNTHQRLLLLSEVPALLCKARYLGREADNHTPPRPGIFMHKFDTTHEIAGVAYGVWLYVRETPGFLIFYDLDVVDIPS